MIKLNKSFFILLLPIFLAALLLRLPGAILPPTEYLYDPMEEGTLFSILTLFSGHLPWGITLWSVGIISLPLVLLYALGFLLIKPLAVISLLHHDAGVFIREFSIYLAQAFLNPTPHLIAGRIIVAVITSFASLAVFEFFRRRGKTASGYFSAIILLSSPFFVIHSHSLMTDTLGLTFFAFALLNLLGDRQPGRRKIFTGGIFLGLAIAAKFTYAAFLPAALLTVCLSQDKASLKTFPELIKRLLVFTLGLLIPVLIFVPFIWTAPLTLAKNILGILKTDFSPGNTSWSYLLGVILPAFINNFGLFFCIAGFLLSPFILDKKTALLLISGFLLFFIPQGQAGYIEYRHALPTMVFFCIFAGIGIELISFVKRGNIKSVLTVLVIGIAFILNLAAVTRDFKGTHSRTNASDAIDWVKGNVNPGSSISVPEQYHLFFIPNPASLRRWIKALNKSEGDIDTTLTPLFRRAKMQYGVSNKDNPLLPAVFCTLEEQRIFIYKLILWHLRNSKNRAGPTYTLYLHSKNDYERRTTLKTQEVLRLFQEGKVEAFISEEYLPQLPPAYILRFDRSPGRVYFAYRRKAEKSKTGGSD